MQLDLLASLTAPSITEEPLRLERNLALMAGAGAGKTHSLMTLCLHLLTGARRSESGAARSFLQPRELCLVTFTDKAAGELRQRLRQRVLALTTGSGEESEPLLAESLRQLGKAFPTPEEWRRLADGLNGAFVGTFHALCIQILRSAPPGAGVDLAFELLDERAASELISQVAERVVLEQLEAGDVHVATLVQQMGLTGAGRSTGLADALSEVFARIREEGVEAESVITSVPEVAKVGFEEALANVKIALGEAKRLCPSKGKWTDALPRIADALLPLTAENFLRGWSRLEASFAGTTVSGTADFKAAVGALKYGCLGSPQKQPGIGDYFAGYATAFSEKAFLRLLGRMAILHREELDRRSSLDFTELLVRARNLLRDHPEVRKDVQARMGALLVDEFQDTNRLQLEMVLLLAPKLLCVVGDRKQSIYEFRGADVSVFESLAQKIESEGGVRHFLQTNRRSAPALLEFFNAVFASAMSEQNGARDYEVSYRPEHDDLRAHRPTQVPGPLVERLVEQPQENSAADRDSEADLIARRIKELVAEDAPELVVDGSVLRRARGGDIAILFRAFTQLERYRQALIRHGIPHRVVGGRGFYAAPEVLDVASFLSLLADPQNRLALAAVLRSPWVGVADGALFELLKDGANVFELKARSEGATSLRPQERTRVGLFLTLFDRLRSDVERLSLRSILKIALEEMGYPEAVAGTSFGEQALANLDKLLELAAKREARSAVDCEEFARELTSLVSSEPREEQADMLDGRDARAVNLLTIHRAKGLEWPIVFVPDLAAARKGVDEVALYDRKMGLSLRPRIPELPGATTPWRRAVQEEQRRRREAENRRTLYVALTRARDYLVLSGQRKKTPPPNSWRKLLDNVIDSREGLARSTEVGPGESGRRSKVEGRRDGAAVADAKNAWDRIVQGPKPVSGSGVFTVTQLQDFNRCPRRYFLAHEIGLREFPAVLEVDEESGETAATARSMGVLAHRMLERVDLVRAKQGPSDLNAHLAELVSAEGINSDRAATREVSKSVARFFTTELGQRLLSLPSGRVLRELPFLLALKGPTPGSSLRPSTFDLRPQLKGQIDLLTVDDDGGVTVVDYKFAEAPPDPALTYGFQLDCYALAARHFTNPGAKVRTALVFLRGEKCVTHLHSASDALQPIETRVIEQAKGLMKTAQNPSWPKLAQARCQALHCGYQYRCHSAGRGL